MGIVESWSNFERHNGGLIGARARFEDFCAELLSSENPNLDVHQIACTPGDGGIDVLIYQAEYNKIDVYQCKYFRDALSKVQWKQIHESFSTAVKRNNNIHAWYLCLPKILSKKEWEEWESFIQDQYNKYDLSIKLIDGNQLITRAEEQGISNKWFDPYHSDSSPVLEDIRTKIWRACQTYYGLLFSGNNKFSDLSIFENLFPNGVYKNIYFEPQATNKEGQRVPIQEIFQDHMSEHLVLMGEGGIGKTTFLAHQMSVLLKEMKNVPDQIPIYVELNKCPNDIGKWYSSRYRKTNFITRYIKSIMDGKEFESYIPDQLIDIEQELLKENKAPQYVLLLDGFNEISTMQAIGARSDQSVRELLRSEIEQLAQSANIRIILTTRHMAVNYLPNGFNYVMLHGIEVQQIKKYLTYAQYTDTEIAWIEAHPELLECLRIPLFLCMFACRNRAEMIKPLTRGEILYHFFHRGTPFYSEKKNIKQNYADDILLKKMLMFTIDFMLPTIGYCMNDKGAFCLSKKELQKQIETFFRNGVFFEQDLEVPVFIEYESETESLVDLKEKLSQIPVNKYIDIIVNLLGIMKMNGIGSYSFVHHHIRDYFASYYIIQCMRKAIAIYDFENSFIDRDNVLAVGDGLADKLRYCLEPVFYEIPDETIISFIGEILGEHRNIPVSDKNKHWYFPKPVIQEQMTLRRILNIYRYSSVNPRYLIYNIVEIIKKVRKTVAGEVFDGLDVRNCRFYETICSVGIKDSRFAASFRKCKVENHTFLFEGHIGRYLDFVISHTNYDRILTLGDDEQVCLWDRVTHRILSSHIVGSSVVQEGIDPNKKLVMNSVQTFLTRYYEDTDMGRKSYIEYVRNGQDDLLLSVKDEDRIIDEMGFSPFEKYIFGVWGGDTLHLFTSDEGKLFYSYVYTGKGLICHIAMPQEKQIIMHVRLSKQIISKNACYTSEWAFFNLDMNCNKIQLIYQYQTRQAFDTQANEPFCAFNDYQSKCLIYSNNQLILINLESGDTSVVDELPEDIIPERGEFLDIEGKRMCICWKDTIKLYNIEEQSTTIHHNKLLEQCVTLHMVGKCVYLIDENGTINEWNLDNDVVIVDAFPTTKLDITGIHADNKGHILVEYSNNCILTIDESSDCLLSTFYDAEKESNVEVCTYLEESNLYLIVLHNLDYEQILLYDPVSGKRDRLKVTFTSQLKFCSVYEEGHMIYIAFDRKVIVYNMDTRLQTDIWQANAGEVFFEFDIKEGIMYLLLQWTIVCRKPFYLVFIPKPEGGYEQGGIVSVIYISEKESKSMLLEKDIEFFVKDPITNKDIYTARGIILHPTDEIRREYSSFNASPEKSTRVFFYVDNYDEYFKGIINHSAFVMQNNQRYLTILKDYEEVFVYNKDIQGGIEQEYIFTPSCKDDNNINLYNAVMGSMGHAYCVTSNEKLIKVDPKTGEIRKHFSWLPGIIITGCDFTGTWTSEYLKKILLEHGGKVE